MAASLYAKTLKDQGIYTFMFTGSGFFLCLYEHSLIYKYAPYQHNIEPSSRGRK